MSACDDHASLLLSVERRRDGREGWQMEYSGDGVYYMRRGANNYLGMANGKLFITQTPTKEGGNGFILEEAVPKVTITPTVTLKPNLSSGPFFISNSNNALLSVASSEDKKVFLSEQKRIDGPERYTNIHSAYILTILVGC